MVMCCLSAFAAEVSTTSTNGPGASATNTGPNQANPAPGTNNLAGATTSAAAASAKTNSPTTKTNKVVERVRSISPPLHPLPAENLSADVTKFSFLVYGDTRGRRDGKDIQYEHSMVIDSMLDTIKKRAKTAYPVKFVLQSGDAVVNGREPRQWNASFVSLINRITTEGGVPYFLAPGNHDVTGSESVTNAERKDGLTNYLAAVSQLIPPDGAHRRLDGFPCFAFGYGNSFFLALDSNISASPVQYSWVTNQLAGLDRARYTNVFAFFHHPPFSSGGHGASTIEAPAADIRKRYMPLFRQHHIRAIFAGHEHFFEHWVERYQDKATNKFRLDMIITGGGGAPLYAYRGEPSTDAYKKMFEKEKIELEHLVVPGPKPGDNPYHYVLVQVDGTQLKLEVIGIDWGSGYKPYQSNKTTLEPPSP